MTKYNLWQHKDSFWSWYIMNKLTLLEIFSLLFAKRCNVLRFTLLYRLSVRSCCSKTNEQTDNDEMASLQQPWNSAPHAKFLLCLPQPRMVHPVAQLCFSTPCPCSGLCLLLCQMSSSNYWRPTQTSILFRFDNSIPHSTNITMSQSVPDFPEQKIYIIEITVP